ncbi:MAG TPA: hypothetical protein VF139_04075 [Candidatus Polarisedimenticolaceae bacterium]
MAAGAGKRALAAAALVAAGTIAGAVLAEGVLRLARLSAPIPYRHDRDTGTSLRPGADGLQSREGHARLRVNAAGMRDVDHAIAKPPGVVRVAVLGDSFAEAAQVEIEETFFRKLGPALEACGAAGSRKVEVLNFGVSGWGTAQELVALRTKVRAYAPDVVLLLVVPTNDLRNNVRELEGDPGRPYFVLRDGALEEDVAFRETLRIREIGSARERLKHALVEHSRVVQLLLALKAPPAPAGGAFEAGLSPEVFLADPPAAWANAWSVTEALIEAAARESAGQGARFWLVSATAGVQVDPDPGKRVVAGGEPLAPERRLEALAARLDLPYVALAPILADEAARTGTFFHGFPNTRLGTGHWNADGHRAVAEAIASRVCAQPSRFLP